MIGKAVFFKCLKKIKIKDVDKNCFYPGNMTSQVSREIIFLQFS